MALQGRTTRKRSVSRISFSETLPDVLTAYTAGVFRKPDSPITAPKWPEIIAARARIESARIRAQKEFLEAIRQARQRPQLASDFERLAFCTYITSVWLALTRELCSLGRRRAWRHLLPADYIRELLEHFLEDFTISVAHPEDGKNRYGQRLEGVVEHHLRASSLSPGFRKLIEEHALWREGRAALQAAADYQAGNARKSPLPRQEQAQPFPEAPAIKSRAPGAPRKPSTNAIYAKWLAMGQPSARNLAMAVFPEQFAAADARGRRNLTEKCRQAVRRCTKKCAT
jgi:hypothetical protein